MSTRASVSEPWGDPVSLGPNTDGVFNSADLVQVFQRGEYEDAVAGNSKWSDGDWTSDHDFDSSDLVKAFQFGGYEEAAGVAVAEPSSTLLGLIGFASLFALRRLRG